MKSVITSIIVIFLTLWITKIFALHSRKRKFARLHGCKEAKSKVPLKDPFFGIDFVWETIQNAKRHHYLEGTRERFKEYGTTFASKHLLYNTIYTIEPRNIQQILATGFDDFKLSSFRVDAMIPLFGRGIFTTDGPEWKHSRALIRPSFDRYNIFTHLEAIEVHIQNFLNLIPKDGSVIDLQDLFFKFTMDTGTEFFFGHSVQTLSLDNTHSFYTNSQKVEDAEFVKAYKYSCIEATKNMRLGALQHFKISPPAKRAQKITFDYIDSFVDEAIRLRNLDKLSGSEDGGKYVFLRELAKDTGDRVVLRDQILNVLLAARDTTATLLSNMFWELARQPEIYAKLREEVKYLGKKPPLIDDIKEMKYLRRVINETLRLHPPVPANTREAIRDTFLPVGGGSEGKSPIFIEKGTHIYYSEFLPFNGGPRICLGQQFAVTEASYLTVRLVQHFEKMDPCDSKPWTELYTIVAYSLYGTLVSLTPAK